MGAFSGIDRLDQIHIWDGVVAQAVQGDRTTLAVIELDPGCAVPEHSHDNEQLGVLVRGSMRFRVADEQRDVGPGDTWRIASGVPHAVVAGAEGALAVECFTPGRGDWETLERLAGRRPPPWPAGGQAG
jgi:quercetin dioxygenase-like cupin family protein